jgi:hypothetical protein
MARGLVEAASGFEPLNGGFADLSLSHLGTPPHPQRRSKFNTLHLEQQFTPTRTMIGKLNHWRVFASATFQPIRRMVNSGMLSFMANAFDIPEAM